MSFITHICLAQTTADAGLTLGQVMGVDLDKWTEKVRRCEYLAEDELKALCEYVRAASCLDALGCMPAEALICCSGSRWPDSSGKYLQVKEILVEESNVQPVNAPVTVRSG